MGFFRIKSYFILLILLIIISTNSFSISEKSLGIDYHSFGSGEGDTAWRETAFIGQYEKIEVRNTVKSQLDQIKIDGFDRISTRLWFTHDGSTLNYPSSTYQPHFPLSNQEILNIKEYAKDVASKDLTLSFVLLFNWCADYSKGDPSTIIGEVNTSCPGYTSTQYIAKVKQTVTSLLDAVKDVKKSDGSLVVDRIYFNGETILASSSSNPGLTGRKNERWLFKDSNLWTWFYYKVKEYNIIPTTYFQALPTYINSAATTPELTNHMSMDWVYLSLKWMKENNLPIPDRIDFDFYLTQTNQTTGAWERIIPLSDYPKTVTRIFNDFEATVWPLLGRNADYSIEETNYFSNDWVRYNLQKAFKENFYRSHFKGFNVWTTPTGIEASGEKVGLIPPFNNGFLTNEGKSGLISFDTPTCPNDTNLCSGTITIRTVEPATPNIVFSSVIDPSSQREILLTCSNTNSNSSVSWIKKDTNYIFSVYIMKSTASNYSCALGEALLQRTDKLLMDKKVLFVPSPLSYSWYSGDWSSCVGGNCSTSGTKSRTVQCQSSKNDIVADSFCTTQKPSTTQPCDIIPCNSEETCSNGICIIFCTESDWTYSDGTCQSNNTLTRNWYKINNCTNGVNHPASESITCNYTAPTCESFTYSDWAPIVCPQSQTQSRTILTKTPANCQGGNQEAITRTCTYIPTCTESYWDFTLVPSICPSNGQQTKKYFKVANCSEGVTKTDENVSCNYNSPQCQYTYSEYGECINGIQTRTATATNQPCQGPSINLTKTCQITPTCTESHWSFTLSACINEIQLKDWTKISDCNNGIQHFDENISCTEEQEVLPFCNSNDWTSRIEPTTCPSTGKQTKYWTRTNSNCQAGETHTPQEIINCTPTNNQTNNPIISTPKCTKNEDCKNNEKCDANVCVQLNCQPGELIENHICIVENILIDLNQYIEVGNIELIEQSQDSEAIDLLNQAKQSLSENNEIKAIAQINTALLKVKLSQNPTDQELQTTYEQILQALNEGQYEEANDLAINALNNFSTNPLIAFDNQIILLAVIICISSIIVIIHFRKKEVAQKAQTKEEILKQLRKNAKKLK